VLGKIFITGGAGFIGSHVIDLLINNGYSITVYDNLSSGNIYWIDHHFGKDNFTFLKADLLDFDFLQKAIAGQDLVWHLAANTDIPNGYNNTDLDLKNCVIGTYNVLESMKNNGIKPIIFSSSGAVYGDISELITENTGPLLPISLYAAGKLSCEGFISAYCSLFDLRGWVFRFSNVIGNRMGHGVIHDFIHKLLKNPNELEILGNGQQEKNFFLVEECIDGMIFAFNNFKEKPCNIFNLGSNTTTKVIKIAQIVMEEMGLKNVKVYFTGESGWPGDVQRSNICPVKINAAGWHVKHTSDEAIRIAVKRLLKEIGI
jgi:UDP-glucose 4-epimerase